MTPGQKIPKLRFPEFSGDWEEKRFGDFLSIGSGRDYKHLGSGDIPVYGTGGFMLSVDDFLYDGESVCIGRKGTIDNPILLNGKFWTVDTLFYTHSFTDCIPKFVFAIFQNVNWKEHNEGSGVPSLSKSTIEKLKTFLPSLPEQKRIANFLGAVDYRIATLTQKHELLAQYKRGIMQKIFTQKIRFTQSNGEPYPDWEEKKLGDLLDNIIDNRGKTPPTSSFGIPLIEVNAIGEKQVAFDKVTKFVDEDTYVNWFRKHLAPGDVLFSTVGNTAICSHFQDGHKAVIAQNIVGLRFQNMNKVFSYYLLTYPKNNLKFKQIEMVAVQPSVKVSQMVDIFFFLPHPEEQQKIADFLSAIDAKIDAVAAQIEQTTAFKKGLLQQMFV